MTDIDYCEQTPCKTVTRKIVGPEVVENMRRLAERPTIAQEAHPVLIEFGFAVAFDHTALRFTSLAEREWL